MNPSLDDRAAPIHAAWAHRPGMMPRFIRRRATGAIIRFQPAVRPATVVLCVGSVAGLSALALAISLHLL